MFEDGFEAQNLSGWPASATNNGALSAVKAAHLVDDWGLQASLTSTNPLYVEDTSPTALWRYRARFWFDPNTATVPAGGIITLFEGRSGANNVFRIQLQNSGGYQLRAGVVNDAGSFSDSGWQAISDAPHSVDLYWRAATNVGANDGSVKLAVDGLLRQSVTGVDNDTVRLEEVRLGAMSLPAGVGGALYFDGFQSWAHLPAPFRSTDYDYVPNTNPSVWILDRVRRQSLKDTHGNTLSEALYAYDGTASGIGTQGELTLQQVVNVATNQTLDTAYVYDPYGNVTKSCAYTGYGTPGTLPGTACSAASGPFRASTVSYDTTLSTYAVSQTNPLGQTASTAYDFALGVPTSATDINSNTTTTAYDGLGRVKEMTYPGYSQPNVKYLYPAVVGGAVSAPFKLELQAWDETASPAQYRSAWTISDGLGRGLQVQGPSEDSAKIIVVDTKYNALGQTQYSGLPRLVTGSGGTHYAPDWSLVAHSTPVYDALGRVISNQSPDGTRTSIVYNGLRTGFFDPLGRKKVQVSDAFGRMVAVEEYTGTASPYGLYAVTKYDYDLKDQLTKVTDALGNQTTLSYDGFGRKVEMTDPDMGNWRYRYDALGNLTAQIDAKRQAINFYYDDLNRLKGKTYNAGPVNADTYQPPSDPGSYTVSFTYDAYDPANQQWGKGRRTGMTDASGTTSWKYNKLGQATNETRTIGGTQYVMSSTYDAFGRVLTQTYPNNETLTYAYNTQGILESVSGTSNYVTGMDYNASGQITSMVLGNGVTTTNTYNSLNARLTSAVSAKIPGSPLLNLQYQYDHVGNITQLTDGTRNEITNYQYDHLDRLTLATATQNTAIVYSRNWSYDQVGNITNTGILTTASPYQTSSSVGSAYAASTSRGRLTAFTGGGSYAAFTKGQLGVPPVTNPGGRASVASGALNTSNATRNSVTAFTGGSGVQPFTKGPNGTYPGSTGQGWQYTLYTYGDSAHKHAVTGLSTGETYTYDANGNMTQRVEGGATYTQSFDIENRLASVTVSGQTTTFVYDGSGNLIKKIKPDNSSTIYIGGVYEVDLNASSVVTKKTSYYPAGGAMRVEVVGGSNTLYYLLKDHLGSAGVTLDASGNAVANGEQRYYPFGESRITSASLPTDKLFTGQREVGLGGLYHYGARFYSSKLGRFLSPDTLIPSFGNPQSLNRYSYVFNNPLKFIDPTGHVPCRGCRTTPGGSAGGRSPGKVQPPKTGGGSSGPLPRTGNSGGLPVPGSSGGNNSGSNGGSQGGGVGGEQGVDDRRRGPTSGNGGATQNTCCWGWKWPWEYDTYAITGDFAAKAVFGLSISGNITFSPKRKELALYIDISLSVGASLATPSGSVEFTGADGDVKSQAGTRLIGQNNEVNWNAILCAAICLGGRGTANPLTQTTSSNTIVVGVANSPVSVPIPGTSVAVPVGGDIGPELAGASDWAVYWNWGSRTVESSVPFFDLPSSWLPSGCCVWQY